MEIASLSEGGESGEETDTDFIARIQEDYLNFVQDSDSEFSNSGSESTLSSDDEEEGKNSLFYSPLLW